MSAETVEKCFVCVALSRVENIPGDGWVRESETFMNGYVAGLVHSLAAKYDPEALARMSLADVCARHSMQMIAHTQKAFNAFVKRQAP